MPIPTRETKRDAFFFAHESGLTRAKLRWGEHQGKWRHVRGPVWRFGPSPPTALDDALAVVLMSWGAASDHLAGVLTALDSVTLVAGAPVATVPRSATHRRLPVRTRDLPPERIVDVHGFMCTDGLQTIIDLAATLDDDVWEQALESGLRKKLFTIDALTAAAPELSKNHTRGLVRIRRVLACRPVGAPPTESYLETLMVQIVRTVPGLPPPVRQLVVYDRYGVFVARIDLAWPQFGVFLELDGQHHKDQPVHDANRQNKITIATGWLGARFTYRQATEYPTVTARDVLALVERGKRHLAAAGRV
jgi:hypothetical protein